MVDIILDIATVILSIVTLVAVLRMSKNDK